MTGGWHHHLQYQWPSFQQRHRTWGGWKRPPLLLLGPGDSRRRASRVWNGHGRAWIWWLPAGRKANWSRHCCRRGLKLRRHILGCLCSKWFDLIVGDLAGMVYVAHYPRRHTAVILKPSVAICVTHIGYNCFQQVMCSYAMLWVQTCCSGFAFTRAYAMMEFMPRFWPLSTNVFVIVQAADLKAAECAQQGLSLVCRRLCQGLRFLLLSAEEVGLTAGDFMLLRVTLVKRFGMFALLAPVCLIEGKQLHRSSKVWADFKLSRRSLAGLLVSRMLSSLKAVSLLDDTAMIHWRDFYDTSVIL